MPSIDHFDGEFVVFVVFIVFIVFVQEVGLFLGETKLEKDKAEILGNFSCSNGAMNSALVELLAVIVWVFEW
jgi:hypothetical protein